MVIAGIFNACMDVVQFHFSTSIFKNLNKNYFNPAYSSANKWKDGFFLNGEKFFGSSTFLVFLTDFWHLSKFMMLLSISASIVIYQPIIGWYLDWFLAYLSFTIPFEIFYRLSK
jgi:hypothetical protein